MALLARPLGVGKARAHVLELSASCGFWVRGLLVLYRFRVGVLVGFEGFLGCGSLFFYKIFTYIKRK